MLLHRANWQIYRLVVGWFFRASKLYPWCQENLSNTRMTMLTIAVCWYLVWTGTLGVELAQDGWTVHALESSPVRRMAAASMLHYKPTNIDENDDDDDNDSDAGLATRFAFTRTPCHVCNEVDQRQVRVGHDTRRARCDGNEDQVNNNNNNNKVLCRTPLVSLVTRVQLLHHHQHISSNHTLLL
jgi:hypothetical protein